MDRFLSEAIVINQAVVLGYAQRAAADIPHEAIKEWLQARVRNMILNDTTLLTPFHDQVPGDAPGYIQQAVQQGQPIFQFKASPELDARIQHVRDFLDALFTAAIDEQQANPVALERTKLAIKLLSKIPRMTFAQVEEQHERWSATAGRQVANFSKEGCEVVHTFEDGMYWVRYTDLNTMKRDGEDLQNCLRNGNYWSSIQDKTQAVYGLRKPNDEAVVGVRVQLVSFRNYYNSGVKSTTREEDPEIVECKGKQNGPALPQYVPHIMQLLRILGVTNDSADLTNAGIFVNNGNYGTFEDVAEVIFDQDGVRVLHNPERKYGSNTIIRVGRHQFWGKYFKNNRTLSDIDHYETLPLQQIKKGLERFNPVITRDVTEKLANIGLVASANGYGTVEDVGQTVWTGRNGEKAITVLREGSGYVYLMLEETIRLPVQNNTITRFDGRLNVLGDRLVEVLNAAKLRFDAQIEMKQIWSLGYIGTSEGYRYMYDKDISKVVYRNTDVELIEITAKTSIKGKIYFLDSVGEKDTVTEFILSRKKLVEPTHRRNSYSNNSWKALAIQHLVEAEEIKDIDIHTGLNYLGVYKDPIANRFRSSLKRFVEIVKSNEAYLYDGGLMNRDALDWLLGHGFQANRTDGELSDRAQTAIASAFRPKADSMFRFEDVEDAGSLKVVDVTPSVFPRVLNALPKFKEQAKTVVERLRGRLEKALKPGAVYQYKGYKRDHFSHYIESANRTQRNKTMEEWNSQPEEKLPPMEQIFKVLNVYRRGKAD